MNIKEVKIVFLGTTYLASVILEAIHSEGFNVSAVITQPDKDSGRGHKLSFSEVKKIANRLNLNIFQPTNKSELTEIIKELQPELIITVAYGMIIPQTALDIPRFGSLNIHPSLLPKYRGPSPIITTILKGDKKSGITIIKMTAGMDEGPILLKSELSVNKNETTNSLTLKLADLGSNEIVKFIPRWINGDISETSQNCTKATYCKLIKKEDGKINWEEPTILIERMVRAFLPWPGTYTFWSGKLLKIIKAEASDIKLNPGKVKVNEKQMFIGTGSTSLKILELQLEGKRKMLAEEFINGYSNIDSQTLF